ncbi:MAG: hypothetical protein K9J16_00200 [Melioribacteraceae bacterium]|nr:hypothetical protein [Melioribacteraceae bacterium]MCF8353930.1 hypothetical protein [Melioribacteraceae bacterium]MCF8392687.1 hypothetical protein [Melioribacteraceae bacterium]MCF8417708.1 hypothetical protein [Melioribacteraceae bacterium]
MKRTFIILLVVIIQQNCFPQQAKPANPEDDIGWFSLGLGAGSPYELSSVISLNYGRENIIQVVYHSNVDFALSGRPNGVSSIAINYGVSRVTDLLRLAISIGPGYVFGKDNSAANHKNITFNTIGLISNLQMIFSPFKELGIGLDLFLNLNNKQAVSGISLTFVLEGNK